LWRERFSRQRRENPMVRTNSISQTCLRNPWWLVLDGNESSSTQFIRQCLKNWDHDPPFFRAKETRRNQGSVSAKSSANFSMTRKKIIYRTKEKLYGRDVRSKEWFEFEATIEVLSSRNNPVHIDLRPIDQHPFIEFSPLHRIKADSLSGAFIKVITILKRYGMEWRR
jgi:hypothetical protein